MIDVNKVKTVRNVRIETLGNIKVEEQVENINSSEDKEVKNTMKEELKTEDVDK